MDLSSLLATTFDLDVTVALWAALTGIVMTLLGMLALAFSGHSERWAPNSRMKYVTPQIFTDWVALAFCVGMPAMFFAVALLPVTGPITGDPMVGAVSTVIFTMMVYFVATTFVAVGLKLHYTKRVNAMS